MTDRTAIASLATPAQPGRGKTLPGITILVGLAVVAARTSPWGLQGVLLGCGLAIMVWAVGALRNHPLRTVRDVGVFFTLVGLVLLAIRIGQFGSLVLLVAVGIGLLRSTFGQSAAEHNPYRNTASRILMGSSATLILAHAGRTLWAIASAHLFGQWPMSP